MSDIFLSYASEDRQSAKALAGALEQCGWSVWWDRRIPIGMDYAEVIESELTAARCVMVLWSATSVDSEWVKNEAADASKRRILVPVLIEDVQIPFEFRRKQAADLTDWTGDPTHAGFSLLVGDLSKRLGRPTTPAEATPSSPPPAATTHEPPPTTTHEPPPAATHEPRRPPASPPETTPPPPTQTEAEEAEAKSDDDRAHAAVGVADPTGLHRDGVAAAGGPSRRVSYIIIGMVALMIVAVVWAVKPGEQANANNTVSVNVNRPATPAPTVASNAGGGTQNSNVGQVNSNLGRVVGNLHPDPIRIRRQMLVQQLNDASEGKRRNATNALKSEFAADATAVSQALDLLEETKIGELSPQGLINVIYFVNETSDAAWSTYNILTAEKSVAVIERRQLGDRAQSELARFKTRIERLKASVGTPPPAR